MTALSPVYFSHRYSADTEQMMRVNLSNATSWVGFLARRYWIEPVAPWIILCRAWTESERALGLSIDCAAVARCHFAVFVGERHKLSNGQRLELKAATANNVLVHCVPSELAWTMIDEKYSSQIKALDHALHAAGIPRQ